MSSTNENPQSLRGELLTMIHDFAEYDHPCDADEKRLNKATGSIPIHTLLELLDRHPESPSSEELSEAVSPERVAALDTLLDAGNYPKRTRGEMEFAKLFGAKR